MRIRVSLSLAVLSSLLGACSGSRSLREPASSKTEFTFEQDDPHNAVKPAQIADMKETLERVIASVNKRLAVPPALKVYVIPIHDNAFFNPLDLSLTLPYQLVFNDHDKHPKFTRPVWAHEFGHSVFFANIERFAPLSGWAYHKALVEFRAAQDKSKKEFQAYQDLGREIGARIDAVCKEGFKDSEACKQAMEEQVKLLAIMQDVMESMGGGDEIFSVQSLHAPYNEFFADVVAVAIYEDPEAIRDALHFEGEKKVMKNLGTRRDFDLPGRLLVWKDDSIHNALTPSRVHLWKNYLSNGKVKSMDKALLLEKVLGAIGAEVDARAEKNEAMLPVAVMNARLIKRLDAALKGVDLFAQ
jgi:hypothetical protein